MTKEEVFSKVKSILINTSGVPEEDITLEANLKNDLCLDSLDIVELMMEFEKLFDVSIEDDKMETVKTVEEIVDYLVKLTT